MTETSFPQVELPLSDDEWKTIALPMGRGIIDRGGWPYKLTARDSVTDTVTIGVDSVYGRNEAILDGFIHRIDTTKSISVPPVSSDTVYEIGLVYDPLKHGEIGGPITLTSWVAPGDNTGGKSRLVLYRMTRKANLSLGSTAYTEERPRVCPVISVSKESQLPVSGLVLVDTVGVVRTTSEMFRADIDAAGAITWTPIGSAGGGDGVNSTAEIDAAVDQVQSSTWDALPNTLMWRDASGFAQVKTSTGNAQHILNREAGDSRYAYKAHTHSASDLSGGVVDHDLVTGSNLAYSSTNTGSTWVSVVVKPNGQFCRYPSALKYKMNVRNWHLDPETVLDVTPVKYEDKDNGDTRVGFVADSYVSSLPEMVHLNPETGEVEGFNYMLFGVAQQAALRYLNDRLKAVEAENETLKFNQGEILSYLGLGVDGSGRVITEGGA